MSAPREARVAAVNAFANRVAAYVATNGCFDDWSKHRIAVEAVTIAMEDAWHEVEAIAAMDAPTAPDPGMVAVMLPRDLVRWSVDILTGPDRVRYNPRLGLIGDACAAALQQEGEW